MTPFNPLIAIPTYDGQIAMGLAQALLSPFKTPKPINVAFHASSLLAKGFNSMWCEALNNRAQGITHFLMCHADIAPQAGFADILYEEMKDVGADVISAISPMKGPEGLTSTGLDMGDRVRRFTLKEIHAMPHPTFLAENLMVNTGLMLVDITKPWAEKIVFHIEDYIREEAGRFRAVSLSEDWDFSRQVRSHGGKLAATRLVCLEHMGVTNFPNHAPWGRLSHDEGCEV